jgi:hypothetical protein
VLSGRWLTLVETAADCPWIGGEEQGRWDEKGRWERELERNGHRGSEALWMWDLGKP